MPKLSGPKSAKNGSYTKSCGRKTNSVILWNSNPYIINAKKICAGLVPRRRLVGNPIEPIWASFKNHIILAYLLLFPRHYCFAFTALKTLFFFKIAL